MQRRSSGTYSRFGIIAAAALMLLAMAPVTQAQDWKAVGHFGWFGTGKAYPIEEGHFYWVGEFSGTFFNDKGPGNLFHLAGVRCPAYYDLDLNKQTTHAGGYCVITDLDGEQAYLVWENRSTSVGPGAPGPGTFEYTGGTGKYAGISGKNKFTGVTLVNWSDGTTSGYATWNR